MYLWDQRNLQGMGSFWEWEDSGDFFHENGLGFSGFVKGAQGET
jgi:hypothetical protein